DIFSTMYLYQASYSTSNGMVYGPSTNGGDWWFGTNTRTSVYTNINRLANAELTWSRIRQADLGLDVQLYGCFDLGLEYYWWRRQGIISDITSALPYIYGLGNTNVYDNFESRTAQGVNVFGRFSRRFGDFLVAAGASFSFGLGDQYYTALVNDNYSYDYQRKLGTSTSSIWGLRCLGKYESQEEIDALPAYGAKSELRVGDLKYEDVNGDGTVDTNDRVIIGNSSPLMRYSVNLSLGWRNLELHLVGTGRLGGDVDLSGSSYFTGGSGMGNYSAFVLNELGGEYPRLSYDHLTNNFLQSDFWLRDASWFKIQSADLSYRFDFKKSKTVKSLKIDLRGDNLLSVKKLKYVDPEDISVGVTSYPYFRTVTLGAKIIF
ncbi:MAG: SusC/RagA family TonB-linked outer membrane protein, partial [Candidatus Cryptobacteroides sp.]